MVRNETAETQKQIIKEQKLKIKQLQHLLKKKQKKEKKPTEQKSVQLQTQIITREWATQTESVSLLFDSNADEIADAMLEKPFTSINPSTRIDLSPPREVESPAKKNPRTNHIQLKNRLLKSRNNCLIRLIHHLNAHYHRHQE